MVSIVIITALIIMVASLSGALFAVARVGNWVNQNLVYLNTFAAGVFVVVSWNLLIEAFKFSEVPVYTIIAIVIGFSVFFLAEWALPEAHCHHDDDECVYANGNKRKAWKVLLSDASHNIGDGILLVPVFLIDIQFGIIAAVGIVIHEIVQEVAEFFILKRAGYTTLSALQRNFAISSTILIGVFLGFVLTESTSLVGPLIGFTAGGFLHIILIDLLPLTYREARERKSYIHFFVAFTLGIAIIFTVNIISNTFLEPDGLNNDGYQIENRA